MSEHGRVEAATARERAVRVAGLLAELSVAEVQLDGAQLQARRTDLPGLLDDGHDHELVVRSHELLLYVTNSAAEWRTARTELAAMIRSRTAKAE